MKQANLIYIGIKGSVVALNRESGDIVWTANLKGGDFVNVVRDENDLFATTRGEVFCLDPATGAVRWNNPPRGFGTGLATISTTTAPSAPPVLPMAEKRRRDEQAAASASAAATS